MWMQEGNALIFTFLPISLPFGEARHRVDAKRRQEGSCCFHRVGATINFFLWVQTITFNWMRKNQIDSAKLETHAKRWGLNNTRCWSLRGLGTYSVCLPLHSERLSQPLFKGQASQPTEAVRLSPRSPSSSLPDYTASCQHPVLGTRMHSPRIFWLQVTEV